METMADAKGAALELLLLLEENDDDVDSLLEACDTPSLPLLLLAPGDYASAFSARLDPELLCGQQQPAQRLTSSSSSYNTNREHDDTISAPVGALASHLQPASYVIHLTNDTEAMDNIAICAPRKKRTTTKKSVTGNPKPKPTSQRQKEELALLRSQVSELQQELSTLQARVQNSATRFNGTPARHSLAQQRSGIGLRVVNSKCESIWEATANRQQKERYRAESANTELKVSIAEQLKFAKSLQQMVNKRQVRRTP